jgi:hypothetical protein
VALNGLLCLSLGPVYDFVCDLPYWERRVSDAPLRGGDVPAFSRMRMSIDFISCDAEGTVAAGAGSNWRGLGM